MKRQLLLASTMLLLISCIVSNVWGCAPALPKDALTLERAQILAVDTTNNAVLILPAGKSNTLENQIKLILTPETKITSPVSDKPLSLTDLQPGAFIKVVHSSAFTKSIPPQTVAYHITLL